MKNFGGMGGMNMQQMMKQAKEAQAQIDRAKEELAETSVEATAGGGMVTIEMSGAFEVINMKINPAVVDPDDVEMLEDLIIAAANEAISQVNELRAKALPI